MPENGRKGSQVSQFEHPVRFRIPLLPGKAAHHSIIKLVASCVIGRKDGIGIIIDSFINDQNSLIKCDCPGPDLL